MPKGNTRSNLKELERALIVGVQIAGQPALLSMDDSLEELSVLARTAGLEVVGGTSQQLEKPNPKTLIGKGKVEEVQALADELNVSVILFDDELSPRHQRELEKVFGDNRRVVDRTALILDIFAQHASTHEGALQVELAQYEYRLPRLTRAWTHLARQGGGGGGRSGVGGVGLRGPGETQLEVDRREIGRKIAKLKQDLEKVSARRGRYRAQRKRARLPVIALVGYTNAGKSTLLNALAGAEVYVADQLFATLDPTTRKVDLPGGREALFTDTVGFIQKLPTTLVEAFKATLEEIQEADLLLHVVDTTHPNVHEQAEAVLQTLAEIEADHIPILTVLNKIDRLDNPDAAQEALQDFEDAVAVSALRRQGLDELLAAISHKLYEALAPVEVLLPYQEGALIALFHEQGKVDRIEHTRSGVHIQGRIPGRMLARYSAFATRGVPAAEDE
ncbi:MAG: GTPase HflX [Anaerolineales bacterium]|nr:GTPase HflX [Anaerolineales bacterium]MCW5856214.1 GTPase HflX [Anaerolineales bacterium]